MPMHPHMHHPHHQMPMHHPSGYPHDMPQQFATPQSFHPRAITAGPGDESGRNRNSAGKHESVSPYRASHGPPEEPQHPHMTAAGPGGYPPHPAMYPGGHAYPGPMHHPMGPGPYPPQHMMMPMHPHHQFVPQHPMYGHPMMPPGQPMSACGNPYCQGCDAGPMPPMNHHVEQSAFDSSKADEKSE